MQLFDGYSVLGCLSLSEQRADLGPGGLRSHDGVAELRWEPHGEPGQSAATRHQALHAHRGGCHHPGTGERKFISVTIVSSLHVTHGYRLNYVHTPPLELKIKLDLVLPLEHRKLE